MKSSQITLKDIAKQLNLSTSTVSRALQNHPDISKKTKELVHKLAEELDYQPNMLAMNLRKSKSNVIGVVVPQLINHFFSTVLSGIEEVAYDAGYRIMICQSNEDFEREKNDIQALMASRVDGLLISISSSTQEYEHFDKLLRKGFPVVFYDRILKEIECSSVEADDYEGAYLSTEHLIKSGAKRVAHISGPENSSISEARLAGYRAAIEKQGLTYDESLVIRTGLQINDGAEAMEKLLSMPNKPDSVFGINDKVTFGAFRKIKELGLSIPHDISLAGFNNDPLTETVDPPITVFSQPGFEIGMSATKLLLEQINSDEDMPTPKHVKLSGELVVRKSSIK